MKVLVTGHNGYIGSVMVPLLQQAGHLATVYNYTMFHRSLASRPACSVVAVAKKTRPSTTAAAVVTATR